jgi:hypothetical protein
MGFVLLFVSIVGGFVAAQLAQRIVVPLLVRALGERRFVSPSAFDGCSLGIAGGLAGAVLPSILAARNWSLWWTPLIVMLGATLYGLGWLRVLALGGLQREWRIENGRVLSRDGAELRPILTVEREQYVQTDAFNGYSHYFLELQAADGAIATNAYTSEAEFRLDIAALDALKAPVRRLDLVLLWRVEPRKWIYARFSDNWTPILCGPLDRLTDADRDWWRDWTLPSFAARDGQEINAADWRERVARLRAAYPELETPDEPAALLRARGEPWRDFNFDLDRTLQGEGVLALSHARFSELAHGEAGERLQMSHDLDGFATLSPQ